MGTSQHVPAAGPAAGLTAELTAALRAAGCVFAEDEAAILLESARSAAELAGMLARRVQGMPLEHIVGWAEFDSFRVAVAPGVFVPRQRSIFLVEQAVLAARQADGGVTPVVVDLCCGSGAIGAAVARRLSAGAVQAADGLNAGAVQAAGGRGRASQASGPREQACRLYATDLDPAAVACAAGNLAPFHGRALCGNLFDPLPASLRGAVDVLVANAPYVPAAALDFMPREARLHEPEAALNGGADGLELHRAIAAEARHWLRPGGMVLLECSSGQAAASAAILAGRGLASNIVHSAEHDCTVVTGVAGRAGVPG